MSNLIVYQLFSKPLFAVLAVGCFLWVIIYAIVLKNIVKYKFVEIPMVGVCGNLAWEFVWGIAFGSSVSSGLGSLFTWGYRLWFFLDIFIFYNLLRYGHKQISTPELKKHFKPICVFTAISFGLLFYFYGKQGLDTSVGTVTAYFDNVVLSVAYVILILRCPDIKAFSTAVAWLKMLGTGLVSVAVSILWYTNHFLVTLCAITLILDLIYIYIHNYRIREERTPNP